MARRTHARFGTKEIIYGPMGAAKSSELANKVVAAEKRFSRAAVHLYIPEAVREFVQPHQGAEFQLSRLKVKTETQPQYVSKAQEILDQLKDVNGGKTHIVAIDEVQLLDAGIIDVAQELAAQGNYILMSGLDISFRGEPFPFSDYGATMQDLIESVDEERRQVRENAWCAKCSHVATHTQRLLDGKPAPYWDGLIVIERKDPRRTYEARCAECFEMEPEGRNHYLLVERLIAQHKTIKKDKLAEYSGVTTGFEDILLRMVEEKKATIEADTYKYLRPHKK